MALYEQQQQDIRLFRLSEEFLTVYKTRKPDFGFNGLGELTYRRTYSRLLPDGNKEEWWQTIRRVIEGVYTMQKKWIISNNLGWDNRKAQQSAQEMYERMFSMKFLPAGRGLWAWGSPITEEKGLYLALNSCAMVTTENIKDNLAEPFCFLMDASMLGVGVGFDTRGAGKLIISQPLEELDIYQITDDREGWVISVEKLINSYFLPNQKTVGFDYSLIRPAGEPIKGFGGVASGSDALKQLHNNIKQLLNKRIGDKIASSDIVDAMNMIGKCVIAGNVRRTAEIAFGDANDKDFLNLKNYELNPDRMDYGWTSNNSVFAKLGMDYTDIANHIKDNGEPGVLWLDNARAYSRMGDKPDYKDIKVVGANPCFSYNTPILTDIGYQPIGSLDGKTVNLVAENGDIQIGKVFHSGNKSTVKLTLSNNNEIICTPNHLFKTTNGEIIASNAKNNKFMPFLTYTNLDSKYILYGFMQGDGCLGRLNSTRHHGIEAHIGTKDQDIFKLIESRKYTIGKNKKVAYIQDIKDELIALGFDGKTLPNRNFPATFDSWSKKEKASFLRGCFSANGSIISTGRITYKATSRKFIENLQHILRETFDIGSYITTNKPTQVQFSNGLYTLKESYDLNINKYDEKIKFYNEINFYQEYKKQKFMRLMIEQAPYVRSIKDYASIDVYDFSMENNHWGIVNGIIAHNCNEQSLESYESCLLVETFPNRNNDLEDYKRTLKFAYLYAKTVTLAKTHWAETNRVMLRNRRIGLSMSGIAQFIADRGLEELKKWCEDGYQTVRYYDGIYSDWLAIPKSIKVTTVKPSGTVSLLAGATAGIHYPESNFYIRRIRLSKHSDLVEPLKNAGYKVEVAVGQEDSTLVVEFPVSLGKKMRTIKDVSMWEQLSLGAFMQRYWSDNQVSQTVTFDPDTEGKDIARALEYYQYQLKGVSFLPTLEYGAYPQMPYEAITEEEYNNMILNIAPIDFTKSTDDAVGEKFCNNDVCMV